MKLQSQLQQAKNSDKYPKSVASNEVSRNKTSPCEDSPDYLLALFRIAFGLLLIRFFLDLVLSNSINEYYNDSLINFSYRGLDWLPKPEASNLTFLLFLMLAASVAFTIGLYFRISCLILVTTYSYLYFLDATWSTPTRYLVWILLVMFLLTNTHRTHSLDLWLSKNRSSFVNDFIHSDQHLIAIRVIFCTVSFYSGLSKYVNYDWIERSEPLATWLLFGSVMQDAPMWYFLRQSNWGYSTAALVELGKVLSWMFVICEIIGTYCLWHRWTRWFGFVSLFAVQIFTSSITRGMFPHFMMASALLWISPSYAKYILNLITTSSFDFVHAAHSSSFGSRSKPHLWSSIQGQYFKIAPKLLIFFMVFQVLLPLNAYVGQHNPNWSNRGSSSSWHLLTTSRNTLIKWQGLMLDSNSKDRTTLVLSHHGNPFSFDHAATDQVAQLLEDPHLLKQWTDKFIIPRLLSGNIMADQLNTIVFKSLNGRPFQRWLRPNLSDLLHHDCDGWLTGCDNLIEPLIEEFSTASWLDYMQSLTDSWIEKGSEIIYFADRTCPDCVFISQIAPISDRISFILLSGSVKLDIDHDEEDATMPMIGEQVRIPPNTLHSIQSVGSTPACWAYIWSTPRLMSVPNAFDM